MAEKANYFMLNEELTVVAIVKALTVMESEEVLGDAITEGICTLCQELSTESKRCPECILNIAEEAT